MSIRKRKKLQKNTSVKPKASSGIDWVKIRILFVGIFFSICWLALWVKVGFVQLLEGESLTARANKQHVGYEEIKGVRGSIYDRFGNVLAQSVEAYSIGINPSKVKDVDTTIQTLSSILEIDKAKVASIVKSNKKFSWLKRKASDSEARRIRLSSLSGIIIEPDFERVYPFKNLAGQLIGFTNIDDSGLEGLEKSYEQTLSAKTLKRQVQRDARGGRLGNENSDISSLRGKDIYLTIDSQVQFFAEEALAENVEKFGAKWGGCIVVDVPTGDILAWAQYPFFDPNKRVSYKDNEWRNRIAMDALEQGSTIKSFLIAAALEEGVVDINTKINCENGAWKIGKVTIHDDNHSYSILPVNKILHVSSNIGVAKIGLKLGAKKYHSYLDKLGFGRPVDLPLAGQSKGILRPYNKWHELDLATASFGQSFSATLVQVAQAYMCLASDGKIRPLRLVFDDSELSLDDKELRQATLSKEKNLYSKKTMSMLRTMLKEVIEEEGGTGSRAKIPGLVVGGKTGTAQKAGRNGKYGKGRVGSFVGMVPIDNPRYLICVLLDEPEKNQYGGKNSAPVFRDVALKTMAYHGLLPESDDPLVVEAALKEAKRLVELSENSSNISAPKVSARKNASTKGYSNNKVNLNNTKVKSLKSVKSESLKNVPNMVGMNLQQAVAIYAEQGLVPNFVGAGGVVVKQQPAPGTPWSSVKKEKCFLWLQESS